MFHVTCCSIDESSQEHRINNLADIIIKPGFLMLGFNVKYLMDKINLVTFFGSNRFLFNYIYPDNENKIISFIGSYSRCTLIEDNLYLIFKKE